MIVFHTEKERDMYAAGYKVGSANATIDAITLLREINDALIMSSALQRRVDAFLDKCDAAEHSLSKSNQGEVK